MSKTDMLSKDMTKDFRKGLLKIYILKMLDREPMHGYAMMNRIEEVTGIRPSSGSLHPALMKLAAAGLVSAKPVGIKKVFSITPKGKKRVKMLNENFDTAIEEIKTIFESI